MEVNLHNVLDNDKKGSLMREKLKKTLYTAAIGFVVTSVATLGLSDKASAQYSTEKVPGSDLSEVKKNVQDDIQVKYYLKDNGGAGVKIVYPAALLERQTGVTTNRVDSAGNSISNIDKYGYGIDAISGKGTFYFGVDAKDVRNGDVLTVDLPNSKVVNLLAATDQNGKISGLYKLKIDSKCVEDDKTISFKTTVSAPGAPATVPLPSSFGGELVSWDGKEIKPSYSNRVVKDGVSTSTTKYEVNKLPKIGNHYFKREFYAAQTNVMPFETVYGAFLYMDGEIVPFDISKETYTEAVKGTTGVVKVPENPQVNKEIYPTAPVISPVSGIFASPQFITLASPDGAEIRYTTDGTEPTIYSNYYTGSIFIDRSTTIKAKIFRNGVSSSTIIATYVINQNRNNKSTEEIVKKSLNMK